MSDKYRKAVALVERDMTHLRRVRAELLRRADHDVIDDFVEEREADLAYQKKTTDQFLGDVGKKVSTRRRRSAEEAELDSMESAADELEEAAKPKKMELYGRAKGVVARLDRVATQLEKTNPKMAAKIDMISNTIEKKYDLKTKK